MGRESSSSIFLFLFSWRLNFLLTFVWSSVTICLALKRSTRPAVSTYLNWPVKNGWHLEQTSIFIWGKVEPTVNLFPQAQVTWASG